MKNAKHTYFGGFLTWNQLPESVVYGASCYLSLMYLWKGEIVCVCVCVCLILSWEVPLGKVFTTIVFHGLI